MPHRPDLVGARQHRRLGKRTAATSIRTIEASRCGRGHRRRLRRERQPDFHQHPVLQFHDWWGSGLERYLLDGTKLDAWNGSGTDRIMTFYHYGTASSNNGTKNNPCLSADILGDWREEVILRSSDSTQLLIFTTTPRPSTGFYTFMHDRNTGWAWRGRTLPIINTRIPAFTSAKACRPANPDIYLVGSGDVAPSLRVAWPPRRRPAARSTWFGPTIPPTRPSS